MFGHTAQHYTAFSVFSATEPGANLPKKAWSLCLEDTIPLNTTLKLTRGVTHLPAPAVRLKSLKKCIICKQLFLIPSVAHTPVIHSGHQLPPRDPGRPPICTQVTQLIFDRLHWGLHRAAPRPKLWPLVMGLWGSRGWGELSPFCSV